jgi:hypothetical protein
LIYQPATNYCGPDSFTFEAHDGETNSEPATVTLTIQPVNDAPVANGQSLSTDQDVPLELTLTGNDVETNALVFSVVTQPLHGTLSGASPELVYTPETNFHGSDSFTFVADDGNLISAPGEIGLTVNQATVRTAAPANMNGKGPMTM